jgi:hypothetical protein
MGAEANRHREAIKNTVQKVAPEIDQTKILSDEEIDELRRQFHEKAASQELAETLGREGLRERLKQSVKKQDAIRTRSYKKNEPPSSGAA